MPTKAAEMVAYSHSALFSPTLSTLQKALDRGYITGFPGLNPQTLKKYPPQSLAIHKGHMDQTRANQQSTQIPAVDQFTLDTLFPAPIENGEKTDYCYTATIECTGQVFTDQTGRYPITSSTGNTQLLILYDYDSNSIHAEPMKNKSAKSILDAYK